MRRTITLLGSLLILAAPLTSLDSMAAAKDLSERQRFIFANAEITCNAMSNTQLEDSEEDDPLENIAKKHGFTLDELETLSEKYPKTESEVGQASQQQCPKAWEGFNKFYQSIPNEQEGKSKDLDHWKRN